MPNNSNKQIVITGHLGPLAPRPPLPPRPHASYCKEENNFVDGFNEIKKLFKSSLNRFISFASRLLQYQEKMFHKL